MQSLQRTSKAKQQPAAAGTRRCLGTVKELLFKFELGATKGTAHGKMSLSFSILDKIKTKKKKKEVKINGRKFRAFKPKCSSFFNVVFN